MPISRLFRNAFRKPQKTTKTAVVPLNFNNPINNSLNFLKNPTVGSFTGGPNSAPNNSSMLRHRSLRRKSSSGSKRGSLRRKSSSGSKRTQAFNPNEIAVSSFHTLRRPSYAPPPPPTIPQQASPARFTVGNNDNIYAVPRKLLGTGYETLQKELFTKFAQRRNSTSSTSSNNTLMDFSNSEPSSPVGTRA